MVRFSRALVDFIATALTKALTGVTLALALALMTLSSGPVSSRMLTAHVERMAAERLAPMRVSLGGVEVGWTDAAQGGGLRLLDLRIYDEAGRLALRAPQAAARFAFGDSFSQLIIKDLAFIGVSATLTRTPEGRFLFGLAELGGGDDAGQAADQGSGPESGDPAGVGGFGAMLTALSDPQSGVRLDAIRIERARIAYDDQMSGEVWRAHDASLRIEKRAFGLTAELEAALAHPGEGPPWRIHIEGARRAPDDRTRLRVKFEHVAPAALAAQLDILDPLRAVEAPVSGDVVVVLGAGGELEHMRADLIAEAGLLHPGEGLAPVALNRLEADIGYAPAEERFTIRSARFDAQGVSGRVRGAMTLVRGEDGDPDHLLGDIAADGLAIADPAAPAARVTIAHAQATGRIGLRKPGLSLSRLHAERIAMPLAEARRGRDHLMHVASLDAAGEIGFSPLRVSLSQAMMRDAVLPLPDLYPAPLRVEALAAKGVEMAGDASVSISFDAAQASIDGLPAKASGALVLRSGAVSGDLRAAIGPVAMERVAGYWPLGVAPNARDWVAENIIGGVADRVSVRATFDERRPEADFVEVAFDFHDATTRYAPGMTPLSKARGHGLATLKRFDLTVDQAQADMGAAGRIDVHESRFSAWDFDAPITPGEAVLRASGPASAVLALIDEPPLNITRKAAIDPAQVSGRAEAVVTLNLPLKSDLPKEEVKVAVEARLHDFAFKDPALGMRIAGRSMIIRASDTAVRVEAKATADGTPADFVFEQRFDDAPGVDTTIKTAFLLTPAIMAKRGLPAGAVSGPGAPAELIVSLEGETVRSFRAHVDLTPQTVLLDALGWRKRAGLAGFLDIAGGPGADGGMRISEAHLRGPGYSIKGSAVLGPDEALRSLTLSEVKFGEWNDFAVRYSAGADGARRIDLTGRRLDLRLALERGLRGDAAGGGEEASQASGPQSVVAVDLGRVYLDDDLSAYGVKGAASLTGERLTAANIKAKINGSADIHALMERRGAQSHLRLTAPDAGALGRALDIYDSGYGGALRLDAEVDHAAAPTRISGLLGIDDMAVHNAPIMARVLSAGTLVGLLDELEGGGIPFKRIEIPFDGDGKRWRVRDGVAYGRSIGLAIAGVYDRPRKMLDMKGTVSPAFALNGALSNVPVIGELATGGRGQGVIGLSFTLSGSAESPRVAVNPLSALAPGFLRRILDALVNGG